MSEWKSFTTIDGLLRDTETGLPDNHIITIRERRLTVDNPTLIQNNIKTDTITLDLDAEWEGISPVIILGSNTGEETPVELVYMGNAVRIPAQVAEEVRRVDCSVCGLDATGTVRLVTVAAPGTFEVIQSGLYTGEPPEEDAKSILGQLMDAANDATEAAEEARTAADYASWAVIGHTLVLGANGVVEPTIDGNKIVLGGV